MSGRRPPAFPPPPGSGAPRARPSFPAKLDLGGGSGTGASRRAVTKPSSFASSRSTASPSPASLATPVAMPRSSAPLGSLGGAGQVADTRAARAAMVSKLRSQGVQDERVLSAMQAVERHRFVDSALSYQAYEDTSLPIGLGQTISKPNVVARMIELLLHGRPGTIGRVLDIGTGCGYQAAVLSQVVSEVYSIERLRALHEKARENLRHFRLSNVHLILGDGMQGFGKGAPYAGIIAAAGGEAIPDAWIDQLAVGGRIVAPAQTGPGRQNLVVVDKTRTGVSQTMLEPVLFVPLKSGVA